MEKKADQLLSSSYDGIEEYDNDLPKWWRALFIITIVFAAIYTPYYVFGFGPSSEERLAAELAAIKKTQVQKAEPEIDATTLLAFAKDPQHLAAGKAIYLARCLPCHGPEGQGLVGPNLTDTHWIHGGKITDQLRVVISGVPEKGMLAWKGVLADGEIHDVVAYVHSLHGSNPPNPKPPQGEPYIGDE